MSTMFAMFGFAAVAAALIFIHFAPINCATVSLNAGDLSATSTACVSMDTASRFQEMSEKMALQIKAMGQK